MAGQSGRNTPSWQDGLPLRLRFVSCFPSFFVTDNMMRRLTLFCLLLSCAAAYAANNALNDTGIVYCGNTTGSTVTANCDGVQAETGDYPRQDEHYGRDKQPPAKTGGGAGGFDFTALAADTGLPTTVGAHACVKDNVTGLIWEVKTAGGLRPAASTYSWYDGNYPSGYSYHGRVNGGTCTTTGGCDTQSYVNYINSGNGLCGKTNWRMPTVRELQGIVHYGAAAGSPAIDPTYFPNTQSGSYWSGAPYGGNVENFAAWGVDFTKGAVFGGTQDLTGYVRLVSDTTTTSAGPAAGVDQQSCSNASVTATTPSMTINGDEVTDPSTGLTWKRCSVGQTWTGSTCSDNPSMLTWSAALKAAVAAGADWRLPNVKELRSLVEECKIGPAINSRLFPTSATAPARLPYWTGSPANTANLPYAAVGNDAWVVYFDDGNVNAAAIVPSYIVSGATSTTNATYAARLVRGGLGSSASGSTQGLTVTVSGTGTVSSSPAGISNCASMCSGNFTTGATVTLTAQAGANSVFSGWNSICAPVAANNLQCTVSMSQVRAVTATFTANTGSTLTVTRNGSGTVTFDPSPISGAASCNGTATLGACAGIFNAGPVVVTATPTGASVFTGWTVTSGTCVGTTNPCTVTMTAGQNKSLTANFGSATSVADTYTLALAANLGSGSGTITNDATGFVCGSACSEAFSSNETAVTLIAMANADSNFRSWIGDCTGSMTCSVTMSAAHYVGAEFVLKTAPLRYTLTVSRPANSTATGTVRVAKSADNSTIAVCDKTCSLDIDSGTQVTLTASAAAVWSGACSSDPCLVTMDAATKTVTATFAATSTTTYALTVSKLGTGAGTISSDVTGISCSSTCSASFPSGTPVRLTATPTGSATFTGWSGACTNATGPCTVTMNAAASAQATFAAGGSGSNPATNTLTVTKSGSGSGRVYSGPAGIDCGPTCSASFSSDLNPTLTAVADVGSNFGGWSGYSTCSSTNSTGGCLMPMTDARSITATFNVVPPSCTLSADHTPLVPGATTILTASCSPAPTSFVWTGGICASTTGASCTIIPTTTTTLVTGEYTVTGSNAGGNGATARLTVAAAIFGNPRAQYQVSRNANGTSFTITDTIAGRDGIKTLNGIDHLYFSDMSINLGIRANAASISLTDVQRIEELYVAFFGRVPDADGLNFWITERKNGRSLVEIADAFYAAAVGDYSSQTGYTAVMTNTAFITRIYQNVLGRSTVDDAGLATWLAQIAAAGRGSMVNSIIEAAHSYLGNSDASLSAVATLLNNKYAVANQFAVVNGITFYNDADAFGKYRAIIGAVTAAGITEAMTLIGVSDPGFTNVSGQGGTNVSSYQLTGAPASETPGGSASAAVAVAPIPPSAGSTASMVVPGVGPFSGLWSNAEEAGWGLGVTQHGNTNFVVSYSFDLAGRPTWYAMSSCTLAASSCSGDIYRVSGGTPPTQAWSGAGLVVGKVGTGRLDFSDLDHGNFSFTLDGVSGTKIITRRSFAAGMAVPAVDYSDLWWSPGEAGWGATLTQQSGVIFVALHSYDWSGQPLWYVASNCQLVGSSCNADLYQVSGGYPLTQAWSGTSGAVRVGSLSLSFSDAATGTMTYSINGAVASRSIARQPF